MYDHLIHLLPIVVIAIVKVKVIIRRKYGKRAGSARAGRPAPRGGPSRNATVFVVFARPAFRTQSGRQRGARFIHAGMHVERGLILPQFQQHQLVGVERALEHLELLAARLFRHVGAAMPENGEQVGALAGIAAMETTSRTDIFLSLGPDRTKGGRLLLFVLMASAARCRIAALDWPKDMDGHQRGP